ncbi:hypothetical protein [Streptomyces sp. C1-2]|uniref:hypothetical protein n=1 Tax=Streptomyces sp. C1-2 TaxID=2720022 RepID=UPI0014325560|nr:hypothetical protein [Streptomyces sp. C1-2]
MRGARLAAPLFGLVAAAVLTACGVPPSDVIEAGAPASGMVSPDPGPTSTSPTVSLFFLRDGEPAPYPRRTADAADLEAVVRLLFEGPTREEAATATTRLPRLRTAPRVTVVDDGLLSVRLPDGTASLSRPAMLQLTCTVLHAAPPSPTVAARPTASTGGGAVAVSEGTGSLHVSGDGWMMTQSGDACPAVTR